MLLLFKKEKGLNYHVTKMKTNDLMVYIVSIVLGVSAVLMVPTIETFQTRSQTRQILQEK